MAEFLKTEIYNSNDDNGTVWRYMNIAKYISMLQEQSIYFCQASLLEDVFEGSLGYENKKQYIERYNSNPKIFRPPDEFSSKSLKNYTYINCWHLNEHESAAMWSLYGSEKGSIAVCSFYKSLKTLLPNDIVLGTVNYIDYQTELVPEHYVESRFLFKRKSFSHEKEVRAILLNIPNGGEANPPRSSLGVPGINIKVNLSLLINSVYVSPKAPIWYKSLLQDLNSKYGYNFEIFQSTLDNNPFF